MSAPAWLTAKPIAHRGLHDASNGIIENTITAADAAIAGGFAIECDVQETADGEAVVFHDYTLDRLTTEKGPVRDRKAAELEKLTIRGSRSDTIPTLQAFLQRIGGRVPLVVEIKSRFNGDMRLTKRTCDIMAGYAGPAVVKSFDPAVIAHVRQIAPAIVRGIVAEKEPTDKMYDPLTAEQKFALANFLHFDETRPQFVSWRCRDLPSAIPYLCQKAGGLPVMTWTVRTPEDRARAAKHADQIVFEGFRP